MVSLPSSSPLEYYLTGLFTASLLPLDQPQVMGALAREQAERLADRTRLLAQEREITALRTALVAAGGSSALEELSC